MVKNSAGGFTFEADLWTRLNRFLILGSEGGSYYATEKKLTRESAQVVMDCLAIDGKRVVDTIVAISDGGRAPKNTPALFALAMACKLAGDDATKAYAYNALPKVARIGTHLFQWTEALHAFGGFTSGFKRAVSKWYINRKPESLALQVVKYQSRAGWSNRDILRLAKPSSHERGGEVDHILGWATGKWAPSPTPAGDATDLIWALEQAKALGVSGPSVTSTRKMVDLIRTYRLPREAISTNFLNEKAVWAALLDNGGQGMPMTALVRNLAKMTAIGLLTPLSEETNRVVQILGDEDLLRKSRVHPLQMLVALNTYQSGKGFLGSLTWAPTSQITDALDRAFYASFGNVEPTGLRWNLALDVSGSMGWSTIAGMAGITPAVGAAAMAMITAAVEKQHVLTAFSHQMVEIKGITPRMRLDHICEQIARIPMGATNCSLPMEWALANKVPVDVFTVYTDSETYMGVQHPIQALDKYKQAMGIDAKLIVVGMVSNEFTIADPKRKDNLDVVGFDTSTPNVMAEFAKGNL